MRLALYTTLYPDALPFAAAWYRSVAAQTDAAFDLWVSLDALSERDALAALDAPAAPTWLTTPPGTPRASIRQHALAQLVERYDGIVLVDGDDLLEPTRIAAARTALASCDVSACALSIIDEQERDLGVTFAPPPEWDVAEILPRYNVFGFSNTAYRTSVLRRCLPIPPASTLFDWILATRAWGLGATLTFDRTARMRYRQYGANTARVITPFTAEQVSIATARVREHYRFMLDDAWPLRGPHREAIERARDRADIFHRAITTSSATLQAYVVALNQLPPRYVWWWSVANPDLEELWNP